MTPRVQYRVRSHIKLSNWKDEDSMIQVWCQGMAMSGKIIASSNIFEPSVCHHFWCSFDLKIFDLCSALENSRRSFEASPTPHCRRSSGKWVSWAPQLTRSNIVFRFSGQSHQWSDSCCEARFRRLATRLGAVSDYPCVGKALPTKVNVITTGAIGCCSQSLADSCGAELVWDEQQDWRKTALNDNGDHWGTCKFLWLNLLCPKVSPLCALGNFPSAFLTSSEHLAWNMSRSLRSWGILHLDVNKIRGQRCNAERHG